MMKKVEHFVSMANVKTSKLELCSSFIEANSQMYMNWLPKLAFQVILTKYPWIAPMMNKKSRSN